MAQEITVESNQLLIPMIDARRLEVYTMILDHNKMIVKNTWAEELTQNSFYPIFKRQKLVCFLEMDQLNLNLLVQKGNINLLIKNIFLLQKIWSKRGSNYLLIKILNQQLIMNLFI